MTHLVEIIENDIIYIHLPEEITEELAKELCAQLSKIIDKNEKKFKAIADITKTNKLPSFKAIHTVGRCMKEHAIKSHKSAVFTGDATFRKIGCNSFLSLIGRKDIRVFSSHKEALQFVNTN